MTNATKKYPDPKFMTDQQFVSHIKWIAGMLRKEIPSTAELLDEAAVRITELRKLAAIPFEEQNGFTAEDHRAALARNKEQT